MKNVLVTGGAGYIGSRLVPTLLEQGHRVTVLDRFFWTDAPLRAAMRSFDRAFLRSRLRVIFGDIRSLSALEAVELRECFAPLDACVHLAAFANDQWCKLNSKTSESVNELGAREVFKACRKLGIRRLLNASSCSVYGARGDDPLDEQASRNAYTAYALGKERVEEILKSDFEDLDWTIMRFSTAFGVSQKMRFDLVVNSMAAAACNTGQVVKYGNGHQWRPFLHIKDIARAVCLLLTAGDATTHEVFNVGDDNLVIQIKDLPGIVQRALPDKDIQVKSRPGAEDPRSHRMDCSKFQSTFDFTASLSLQDGILEVRRALESGLNASAREWYGIDYLDALRRDHDRFVQLRLAPCSLDPLARYPSFHDITSEFLVRAGQFSTVPVDFAASCPLSSHS